MKTLPMSLLPFDELQEFRDQVMRFYERLGIHPRSVLFSPNRCWRPPMDIFETEDCVIIRVEIAGVSSEAIRIDIDGQLLRIYGRREEDSSAPKRRMYRMEIEYGEFEQFVKFSVPIKRESIRASYKEGFLTVEVPKEKNQQNIEIKMLE